MKNIFLLFLIVCFYASAQKSSPPIGDLKKVSDSLIGSVIGTELFDNYFNANQINSNYVEYVISINGTKYKKTKVFFEENGQLRTTRHYLKRNLREFLNVERLKPTISVKKAFDIAKKAGLKKINEFKLSEMNSKLVWSIYNRYENGTHGIEIDAMDGKILNEFANEAVGKPE